jgi:hypothetical protein
MKCDIFEGGVKQPVKFAGGDAELCGFDGELVGERTESAQLFGFDEACLDHGRCGDEGSPAGYSTNYAVALKVLEGARNSVGIDAELGSGAAGREQGITGMKKARGHGVAYLLLNLEVNGDSGIG